MSYCMLSHTTTSQYYENYHVPNPGFLSALTGVCTLWMHCSYRCCKRLQCEVHSIIRRNRSSTSDSGYSYTFLCSVVCLSVVCHTRAANLNRSTDLDAIWQLHSRGPMTHCVRWRYLTPSESSNPTAKTCNCKLLLPPGEYKRRAIPPFPNLLWTCWHLI